MPTRVLARHRRRSNRNGCSLRGYPRCSDRKKEQQSDQQTVNHYREHLQPLLILDPFQA